MFFFDKLFPVRKLGSRRNYPHFFSGSEQEKEGEEGKKEKKTKWEKSQRPIKIRLNVVPKKDLITYSYDMSGNRIKDANSGKTVIIKSTRVVHDLINSAGSGSKGADLLSQRKELKISF